MSTLVVELSAKGRTPGEIARILKACFDAGLPLAGAAGFIPKNHPGKARFLCAWRRWERARRARNAAARCGNM